MEGKDGVPLRFPRPVMALIATGTAAISIGLFAAPASADQIRSQEWWLSSLRVTAAWSASQGSGVTVAVLSDGVSASSADLAGAVTQGAVPTGFRAASGQYAGEQGTPIASLIAGRGHGPGGADGIIGVAPKARILSIPVTLPADDPQLAQSSVAAAIPAAIAAGIRYAVNHGASVIDLPIDVGQAGRATAGASAAAGGSAAEKAAVSYALAHNVVLVAPAGDNAAAGDAPSYPAAYHGVIAVGAFGPGFNKAAWSSHRGYVTLTAAGAGVMAANAAGSYQTVNSTSAASALVAGTVALIRSRYPSLTAADIRQALITTAAFRRAGGLATGSGYGALNAAGAMTAAADLATPPSLRASAGALPRQTPATAPAPASAQGLGGQILRAGEVSGALLILLLLMIAAYALTGRRRPSRQPALTADWSHRQTQSRYPQGGSADVDRMLEVFASPAAAPLPTVALASEAQPRERFGARPAGSGAWRKRDEGVFTPTAGRGLGTYGRQPGAPDADELGPGGPPDAGGWLSHRPASRAIGMRPSVSGAPPWEPASAPESELPWAAPAGRPEGAAPAGASTRQAPPVDESAWDVPAHVPGPGATAASRLAQSGQHAPAPATGFEYGPGARAPHGDYEPSDRAFGSPAGASPAGGYPSPPSASFAADPASYDDYGIGIRPSTPARPAGSAGYRSPTGSGAPADFSSGVDYASPVSRSFQAGRHSRMGDDPGARPGAPDFGYRDSYAGGAATFDRGPDFDAPPRVAPSGLPVRQPHASWPAGSAPLSPSGSLWEPVSRDAGPANEPADYPDQSEDTAGRPIFVWDPARTRDPLQGE